MCCLKLSGSAEADISRLHRIGLKGNFADGCAQPSTSPQSPLRCHPRSPFPSSPLVSLQAAEVSSAEFTTLWFRNN